MRNTIVVFLFGILGGLSRYEINTYLPKVGVFPLATLLINLVGCYLFTFLIKNYLLAHNIHERLVLGIGTGFIGAFTTFSSFMIDDYNLIVSRAYGLLALYVLLSISGGLLLAMLGMKHGRSFVLAQSQAENLRERHFREEKRD